MALLYDATLVPGKLDLLRAWLPTREWSAGTDVDRLERVGAYRLDDPGGEVGVEGFLLRGGGGPVLHVPVTYRAARLPGADGHLVGLTEHSVLGTRWVYDADADPVWVTAVATAVLTGGTQAEEVLESGGRRVTREPSMTVQGSGAPGTPVPVLPAGTEVVCRDEGPVTRVSAAGLEMTVVHVVGAPVPAGETLTARWSGGASAVVAAVSPARTR
jgi:Maltokinase N-terminal cap domain